MLYFFVILWYFLEKIPAFQLICHLPHFALIYFLEILERFPFQGAKTLFGWCTSAANLPVRREQTCRIDTRKDFFALGSSTQLSNQRSK